jgi:hypothetical protein
MMTSIRTGNFNPKTISKAMMQDYLNKKFIIDELFNLDSYTTDLVATNRFTTPDFLQKINQVYEKYEGSKKAFKHNKGLLLQYSIGNIRSEKALDYIINNIYDTIEFEPSETLPTGYELLVVCKNLYDAILATKGMDKQAIDQIILYNDLVVTNPEQANKILDTFAGREGATAALNDMMSKRRGGRGVKMNKRKTHKRKTHKRKSIKRKSMKNKRNTYKKK